MQTTKIFDGLNKISTYPIVRFNSWPTLKKPAKGIETEEHMKKINLEPPVKNFNEFIQGLEGNRDFVCSDREWKKNEDVGEWNCFYIDIDEMEDKKPVINPLQYYIDKIKKVSGVYPVASWYTLSSTSHDMKQKHLMLLDTIYTGGKDGDEYKEVGRCIKNLLNLIGINYDSAAFRPIRLCYAKHNDSEVKFVSDPENNLLDIKKWRPKEKIERTKIMEELPSLGNSQDLDENILEGIARTHAKNHDCLLHSYGNLLGVINWVRHIRQYTEQIRDDVLIPWIKEKEKDSEAALLLRIEKDFGSVPEEELEDLTLKLKESEVFEYIYEYLKEKINNEKFVKLLDLEGEAINLIRYYDLLDTFDIKVFKTLINRINYLKQARIIQLTNEEGQQEALEITDFIIDNHNTANRRPENCLYMQTGTFNLDFVKGINLITGVSHSGKSYLSIALASNLGYKTLYYSADQDRGGFIQYCKTLKSNGGIVTGGLLLKNSMGTGIETISKEIELYGVNCVVFDMISQIPVPGSEKMQDQEMQRRQVEVLEELRDKYPDLLVVAIGSVPKGKDDGKSEVTLETHTYGNNIVAHASDFILTIANSKEGTKVLKVLKDRYGDYKGNGRVGIETPPFKKITDLLKVVEYRQY